MPGTTTDALCSDWHAGQVQTTGPGSTNRAVASASKATRLDGPAAVRGTP